MHAAVAALAQLPEAMRDSCLQLVCSTLPVMPPGALGEADVLWLLQWLLVGASCLYACCAARCSRCANSYVCCLLIIAVVLVVNNVVFSNPRSSRLLPFVLPACACPGPMVHVLLPFTPDPTPPRASTVLPSDCRALRRGCNVASRNNRAVLRGWPQPSRWPAWHRSALSQLRTCRLNGAGRRWGSSLGSWARQHKRSPAMTCPSPTVVSRCPAIQELLPTVLGFVPTVPTPVVLTLHNNF